MSLETRHLRPTVTHYLDDSPPPIVVSESWWHPDPFPKPAYNLGDILCWAGILTAVAYFAAQVLRAWH